MNRHTKSIAIALSLLMGVIMLSLTSWGVKASGPGRAPAQPLSHLTGRQRAATRGLPGSAVPGGAVGALWANSAMRATMHSLRGNGPSAAATTGFSVSDVLTLFPTAKNPSCAAIDPAGGFAYFGTFTTPGQVVKVRLSDLVRLDTLTLNTGENYLSSAVIDPTGGFAYFGTAYDRTQSDSTLPGQIVKVRLSDFTRVSAITLNDGESNLISAVIDPAGGFAYFGTASGQVVKVRLSDFTRVAALDLGSEGSYYLASAVIDPAGGFAYFGAAGADSSFNPLDLVVKVRLADFTHVADLTLNHVARGYRCAAIDPAGGFAYFGSNTQPGQVAKVRLADFTPVATLTLNAGENSPTAAVLDPAGGFAYFVILSQNEVVKVRLSDLTRVAAIPLAYPSNPSSAVIDPAAGFAYFGGTEGGNFGSGKVMKVRLSDFTQVATRSYDTEGGVYAAAVDVAGGFAYFGNIGQAVKVRLSDFKRVDTIDVGTFTLVALIDAAGGFAYFGGGGYGEVGLMAKVRLSDFTRVATFTLNPGEGHISSGVIDAAGGFAYFGTQQDDGANAAVVVKVRLSDFTRVSTLTLNPGEFSLDSAVIDPAGGFAYFGGRFLDLGLNVGHQAVMKVRLSDLTRVATLTTSDVGDALGGAVIDPAGGFAYFGTVTSPGRVVKVRLSDFTRVATLTLNSGEDYLYSAVIDPARGFAYFVTNNAPGFVVKVRLSDFTRVGALTLTGMGLPWSAAIDPAGGFAYVGTDSSGTDGSPGRVVKVDVRSAPTAVCAYALSPASATLPASGGAGNFLVQTQAGCAWMASSQANWIHLTAGFSGTGVGAVSYSVDANPDAHPRTGTITVADQSFTLTQAGSCSFSLGPATTQAFTPLGGAGRINLTSTDGCHWTATADAAFISLSTGGGSGTGSVDFLVAPNPETVARRATISIGGQRFSVLQGAKFSDVPPSHPYYDFINKLSASGITNGCGYGNYCPEASVTREQMAIFIERSLGQFNPPTPATPRFTDVPPSRGGYAFIDDFAKRGITAGCGGGNFCPDQEVTRGPMAAFLMRALGVFNPNTAVPQRFFDVPPSNPFYGFIEELAVREITKGCGGGNYCPDQVVNRGQMAVFLVRAFGL